jgi:zinc/manganese transport system substrate-binding protein
MFARTLSICCLLLFGSVPAYAKSLRVVTTVGDLGAIAREVLGTESQVTVIAKPTQDPHFVDAKPSLIIDVNRADALCLMGLDYEIGWLPVLIRGARNPKVLPGAPGYIDTSASIPVLDAARGNVSRSMGDIHPLGNPHFTLDPRNGVRVARLMAERFSALDPGSRATFTRNAESFASRVEAKLRPWVGAVAAARGKTVVTYHRSFVYLEGWLGLQEVDTIEPKPGIPPNPSHVAEVIQTIKARHVSFILQELWYPLSTAELIAKQTGARLVRIPGMTEIGGSYIDHIDEVVRLIAGGLS